MKIYRVHYRDASFESKGFEFFTKKSEAIKAVKQNAKDYDFEYDPDDDLVLEELNAH